MQNAGGYLELALSNWLSASSHFEQALLVPVTSSDSVSTALAYPSRTPPS